VSAFDEEGAVVGSIVYPGFWAVKKLHRLRPPAQDKEMVERNIASTQVRLGALAGRIEGASMAPVSRCPRHPRADRPGAVVMRRLLHAQFTRFALTGMIVAAVYTIVTTSLVVLADAPTQLAVIVGYICALAVHFTANRHFVFASSTAMRCT
jgi:hypothetical protein